MSRTELMIASIMALGALMPSATSAKQPEQKPNDPQLLKRVAQCVLDNFRRSNVGNLDYNYEILTNLNGSVAVRGTAALDAVVDGRINPKPSDIVNYEVVLSQGVDGFEARLISDMIHYSHASDIALRVSLDGTLGGNSTVTTNGIPESNNPTVTAAWTRIAQRSEGFARNQYNLLTYAVEACPPPPPSR